jgi:hypothetical protein
VHPASTVLHRGRLAWAPAACPRSASRCLVHVQEHVVDPLLSVRTLPPALDVADDGLAALVNVNMLDRDLLLTLAAVPVERIEQDRIAAREFVRLAQGFSFSLDCDDDISGRASTKRNKGPVLR